MFLERAWKRAAPRGGSREVIFAEEYETIEAFLAVGFRVGRPPDWVFLGPERLGAYHADRCLALSPYDC